MTSVSIGERRVMICQSQLFHGRTEPWQEKYVLEETLHYNWGDRYWTTVLTETLTDPESHIPNGRETVGRGADGHLCVCRVQDKVLYVGLSKDARQSYLFEYDIPTDEWVGRDEMMSIQKEAEVRRRGGEIDLLTPLQWERLRSSRTYHLDAYTMRIKQRNRVLNLLVSLKALLDKLKKEGGKEMPLLDEEEHMFCVHYKDDSVPTAVRVACIRCKVMLNLDNLRARCGEESISILRPGVLEKERERGEFVHEWLKACDGPEPKYHVFWPPPAHAPRTCCLDGKLVILGGYTRDEATGDEYSSRSVSLYDPDTSCWYPLPDIPAGIEVGYGSLGHAVVDDTLHIFQRCWVPLTPNEAALEAERDRLSEEDISMWDSPKTTKLEPHHVTLSLVYTEGQTVCKWTNDVVDDCNYLPKGAFVGLPGHKIFALGDIAKEACLYDCVSGEWYMIGHLFPHPSEREEESLLWYLDSGSLDGRSVDSRFSAAVLTMSIYFIGEDYVSVLVTFVHDGSDAYHRDKPSHGVVTLNSEILFGDTLLHMPRWDADEALARAKERADETRRQARLRDRRYRQYAY
ncbi:hypothetical protein KIPB_006150 [Kipferlia bialata]|uniref:Uncharacterized protein n=1 Tax=Kipferlia bialata TaxID=797122 RepID=A0A9K3CX61_9EUKA|nr:hypothetical protein KIPB_006150 [Kipferlia bialata]|eukprot:g6150.t1